MTQSLLEQVRELRPKITDGMAAMLASPIMPDLMDLVLSQAEEIERLKREAGK